MNQTTTNVDQLVKALPLLSGGDQGFARDLVDHYMRRGALSDKQWFWVEKLTQRAADPQAQAPKTESVGDFSGVVSLFARAKQKLRFPKITLQVEHQPIQLSLAGARSKYEGQVQVTDGARYGENVWFGRVDTEGNWTQGRAVSDQDLEAVRHFLHAFSQDPAGTAKKHGRLTGRCCFCNTPLKDEHSTAAGFGPVCAKNYGLHDEWKAATALLDAAATEARAMIETASQRPVSVAQ
jgi:hypothetical protein